MDVNTLLPRRNNTAELLSSGDFEIVESAAPPRVRAMSPTMPPPPQSPLASPRSRQQPARSFLPQALPAARPVYQQRMTAPVPQNEAELQRFLSQFEPRTSDHPNDRPSTAPLAVQPARVREEPQPRFPAPFARSATPARQHEPGASSTSSLAPVALSDETGAQSIITSPTFVIPPARTRASWAIFMVTMGGLVGVFISMAVMKYRAEQLAIASGPAQQTQMVMAAAQPPMQPVLSPAVLGQMSPMQGQVRPTQAVQAPQPATPTTAFGSSLKQPSTTAMTTKPSTPTTSTPVASTPAATSNVAAKGAKKPPVVAAPPHHAAVASKPPVTTTAVRPSTAPKGDSAEQMLQAAKRETGTTLE